MELEHGIWELRRGDCLDALTGLASLPDKSCSHVICDPPYSERVHRGLGAERRGVDGHTRDGLTFSHLTADAQAELARHFARVAKRWIIIFTDDVNVATWAHALQSAGAEYCCKGTWVKEAPMPRIDGTRPAYATEEIVIGHALRDKGKTRWNGGGRPALYFANPQEQSATRLHPTQEPLSMMEAIVRDFTDGGEMILDPFAGSGTTGVAALRSGRRFIGFERDAAFAEVASRRLTATREQLALFPGGA